MCGICGELTFDAGRGRRRRHAVVDARAAGAPRARTTRPCGSAPIGAPASAFRRLAIIDLSAAANQPLANEDGSVRVVFNGEIYNFTTLRDRARVARATGSAPTATPKPSSISTRNTAPDFVEKLDGMFALGLWDDARAPTGARARPCRQEAAVLLPRRAAPRVRLGDQGDPRASRRARPRSTRRRSRRTSCTATCRIPRRSIAASSR